ncbi:MAG: sigma-70 family RNA polymerase sigma factor [Halioglobus sp.]|nr:sigma-70 family RNA polymerase sigma factor [Halioglobus sp.]MCP5194329.1 sigma-70 family RNA polymerase sigma factor [Pseudomonadales bacterium]
MSETMPAMGSIQLGRDRRLARQILAGDERALRSFMDEYFPRLYRYARHRLGNEADVDDVVQITLSQAARRLETYRGEATLLTWLVQICRHEISRQLRQNNRDADMMEPFLNDELLRAAVESIEVSQGDCPESANRRSQLISLVQFTLDQLPEKYARALELKYIEGFNSSEIADQLRISDEATQSLLARARRAFRDVCGEALHAAM